MQATSNINNLKHLQTIHKIFHPTLDAKNSTARWGIKKVEHYQNKIGVSKSVFHSFAHHLIQRVLCVVMPIFYFLDAIRAIHCKESFNRFFFSTLLMPIALVSPTILYRTKNAFNQCKGRQELCNHPTVLVFNDNKIKSLPSQIGSFSQLLELHLNNNDLEELPPEIGKLSLLEKLHLTHNNLKALPDQIGELSHLSQLFLDHNNLKTLPTEVGKLTQLRFLHLRNNNLEEIPSEIGKLSQLFHLFLSGNNLKALPDQIGELSCLTHLFLSSNNLKALPDQIGKLSNLTILSVKKNPELAKLPESLGKIPTLVEISIEGTNISEKERDAILDQCKVLRGQL